VDTSLLRRWGLLLAALLALAVYVGLRSQGVEQLACVVAAVAVSMAVLWLTEAIPIPATALLPLVLFPLLSGGEISIATAAAPYANDLIFLFMGGFMLALAMERWELHRRIALTIINVVGDRPITVVLGFMLASGLLSMWISNTATVVMMLPIATSVIALVRRRLRESTPEDQTPPAATGFAVSLLLGTAYASSIGGTATLIGTPPNGMMAAFVRDNLESEITMASWLPLGLLFAWILLPVVWLLLVKFIFPVRITTIPGGRQFIREELRRLGPMTGPERQVLVVFALAAAAWIFRTQLVGLTVGGVAPFSGVRDSGIAMTAALVLFVLPAAGSSGQRLLDWDQAERLPWGVLLLFGGGLSLAAAMTTGGVDTLIGDQIAKLHAAPEGVVIVLATVVVILLTELTSNTATTATFLPILAASAEGLGMEPLRLIIPATLAASCAFMMPVATPPNAIVFGTGEITIRQMCRAGIWVNLVSAVLICALVFSFGDSLPGL
jgi:sodium-dependent dicarboxylate transporter 2/3/5